MEYFVNTKYVKLKSLHNKYLVAEKDGKSIRQSRHGDIIEACWAVEMVNDGPNLIRLRSCHGKLLTASREPFLLGWTGAKVVQTSGTDSDPSVQWEPLTDYSSFIRLRIPVYDKFLRANGGSPPWRKSVTVDLPECAVTHDWILWSVDGLQEQDIDIDFSLWARNGDNNDLYPTPTSSASRDFTFKNGIQNLHNAKTIRLLSHHDKYLLADEDGESVIQSRDGSSKQAHWIVEHMNSIKGWNLVRLQSSFQKYLTATEDNFLLGATGRKVRQTVPKRLDTSIEWELIRDGKKVKLKTWDGNFLRANGGLPPWRNSVTHDVPSLSPTKDCILWDFEVFDVYED